MARFPADAATTALLASHRANRGALAEAEALFRRAIELDPEVAESHARLAAVLAAEGKADEAREAWARARVVDPSLPASPTGR
jgi:Flp pilus assembly protein TadD